MSADLLIRAAEALKRVTGHDSRANLTHQYGKEWQAALDRIQAELRAAATTDVPEGAEKPALWQRRWRMNPRSPWKPWETCSEHEYLLVQGPSAKDADWFQSRALFERAAPAAVASAEPVLWFDPTPGSRHRVDMPMIEGVSMVTLTGASRKWGDFTAPLYATAEPAPEAKP